MIPITNRITFRSAKGSHLNPREQRSPETAPYAGFAKRVLARRNELGLTQEELADRIGVRQQTIHRWEAGRAAPQRRVWPKLEEFLGLDRVQLLGLIRPGSSAEIFELHPGRTDGPALPEDPGRWRQLVNRQVAETAAARYAGGASHEELDSATRFLEAIE